MESGEADESQAVCEDAMNTWRAEIGKLCHSSFDRAFQLVDEGSFMMLPCRIMLPIISALI